MRIFALEKDRFGDWAFSLNLSSLCWLVFILSVGARLGWSLFDVVKGFIR